VVKVLGKEIASALTRLLEVKDASVMFRNLRHATTETVLDGPTGNRGLHVLLYVKEESELEPEHASEEQQENMGVEDE